VDIRTTFLCAITDSYIGNPVVKPAVPAKDETPKESAEETPAEEAKPEAPAEAVTSDTEEAGASDAKADIKRSASKKNKRISGFAAHSFFGKKAKTEEKAEEKKEEEAKPEEEEAKPEDKAAEEAAAAPAGLFQISYFC
jgi:hypothetical protein